jgi:hypothetical protein
MEILAELLISLGSALSAAIGGFITARRRKSRSQGEDESTSIVEVRVTHGKESESVRLNLPADMANRLLREASEVPGSETSPIETSG